MVTTYGVNAQSRLDGAGHADVLAVVTPRSARWRKPADAIACPCGGYPDHVPGDLGYRRPVDCAESRRDRLLSAQGPCVLECPLLNAAHGCRSGVAGFCGVFFRPPAHCTVGQSPRPSSEDTRHGFDPEPTSSGCLIARSLFLDHLIDSLPLSAARIATQGLCIKRILPSMSASAAAALLPSPLMA
jgi:hypothetical protein